MKKRAGERPEKEWTRPLTHQSKGPIRLDFGSPKAPGPAIIRGGLAPAVALAAVLAAWLPGLSRAGERIPDWTFHALAAGPRSSAVLFTSSLTGFAGFEDGRLFKTADAGDTWAEAARLGQGVGRISAGGGLVIAAGSNSAAVSRDGGNAFDLKEVPVSGALSDAAVDAKGRIWVCATGGPILASRDGGGSWKAASPSWPGPMFAIACAGETVLAGGVAGIWEKAPGSPEWKRLPQSAFCRFLYMARDSRKRIWPLAMCGESAVLFEHGGKRDRLREVHVEPEVVLRGADACEYGMLLWTGGRIVLHSPNGGGWKRIRLPESLDSVKGAAQSGKGTIWLAGAEGGLYRGRFSE